MVPRLDFGGMICDGRTRIKKAFLDLYGIACTKDAFVTAHLELFGGSNQWNVSFARAAHD
jgi:hypothetical protein